MANSNPTLRLGNLKPFKKGHDERRIKKGYAKNIKEAVLELLAGSENGKIRLDILMQSIFDAATKDGDMKAADILLERAFGKVPNNLNVDEGQIEILIGGKPWTETINLIENEQGQFE